MNTDLIHAKLESLSRCVHRLDSKKPDSLESLCCDMDAQDIIAVNLERAVQLCVDNGLHILSDRAIPVPATMADTFRALAQEQILSETLADSLVGAVGFRNISVHAYQNVDWGIVWEILNNELACFSRFAHTILQSMGDGD